MGQALSTDPWGRPLSANPEAAAVWPRFLDEFTSYGAHQVQTLQRVTEADPGFALGQGLLAITAMMNGDDTVDVPAAIRAMEQGRADTDWERSDRASLRLWFAGGPWAAYEQMLAHHEQFPDDLVGFSWAVMTTGWSTRSDLLAEMTWRGERTHASLGDHPAVNGFLAMAAQEAGDLERAHTLAAELMHRWPAHIMGAHPMAHVYFESGDHAAGLTWLEGWYAAADRTSTFFPHLQWHGALHQLAAGDPEGALRTYRELGTRPGYAALVDRPSLLWRCQLGGQVAPGGDPVEPTTAEQVRALTGPPPSTFLGWHRVLALAADRDADGLRALARNAADWPFPGAGEILGPIALAYAAYVEEDFVAAADGLLALEPSFTRIGGSHAQREVHEDTLIESLIRSGRCAEALIRLDRRLERRESLLDRDLAARAETVDGRG